MTTKKITGRRFDYTKDTPKPVEFGDWQMTSIACSDCGAPVRDHEHYTECRRSVRSILLEQIATLERDLAITRASL